MDVLLATELASLFFIFYCVRSSSNNHVHVQFNDNVRTVTHANYPLNKFCVHPYAYDKHKENIYLFFLFLTLFVL